jgi:hypothetical protein
MAFLSYYFKKSLKAEESNVSTKFTSFQRRNLAMKIKFRLDEKEKAIVYESMVYKYSKRIRLFASIMTDGGGISFTPNTAYKI